MRCSKWSILFLSVAVSFPLFLSADTVMGSNNAVNPPYSDVESNACNVELFFKPAPIPGQLQHAYLVVTDEVGGKVEVRGGPQRGPGIVSGSSDVSSGNPFSCKTKHEFGAVVPYIGKHGLLGVDSKDQPLYSPDGNVTNATARFSLSQSVLKSSCALANCLIDSARQSASDCKNYILGAAWMRNSNTIISTALTSCGVDDPKSDKIQAPGWNETWENAADN